ncbi:hypothetical protein OROGR_005217 [Orobanche gracilis]
MSADLELCLPLIKIIPSRICDLTDGNHGSCISSGKKEEGEEEDCHTPKSPRHMIPEILSCPAPPRKPTARTRPCKRRSSVQLQFFEIIARDEVETFFRMTERNINGAKRRCVI